MKPSDIIAAVSAAISLISVIVAAVVAISASRHGKEQTRIAQAAVNESRRAADAAERSADSSERSSRATEATNTMQAESEKRARSAILLLQRGIATAQGFGPPDSDIYEVNAWLRNVGQAEATEIQAEFMSDGPRDKTRPRFQRESLEPAEQINMRVSSHPRGTEEDGVPIFECEIAYRDAAGPHRQSTWFRRPPEGPGLLEIVDSLLDGQPHYQHPNQGKGESNL